MSEDYQAYGLAELATRNAQAAVRAANSTRDELLTRIQHLERSLAQSVDRIVQLEQRTVLLMTANFNGGSTAGG